ncbi:MAG: glycine cleavage system aminomethyltransferase GcvT [Candidatus Sericytochromatia bacterium]
MAELQKTALHAEHVALGARMVDFGGWDMPVQYSAITDEHQAVRQGVGLFDVSHMGTFGVSGPGSLAWLESMVPNRVSGLKLNQAQYTQILNQQGGTLDDLLIYRLGESEFQIVVNASNREKDWDWLFRHLPASGVNLENRSALSCILALQGPKAAKLLTRLLPASGVAELPSFYLTRSEELGFSLLLARTGYTGEDGFEIFVAPEQAPSLWNQLLSAGQGEGIRPCGLGARDTLRLESAMALYGHELDEQTSPLEAGLGWSVKLDKPDDFIGKSALLQQKSEGLKKKRLGLKLPGTRRAPRQGYTLWYGEQEVGVVTSGSLSPTLGVPIGLALVSPEGYAHAAELEMDLRGQRVPIEPSNLPFYRRTL